MRYVKILIFLFLFPSSAFAVDSLSFNPLPVAVEAKGAGGVPVGGIIAWAYASPPSEDGKWLECNGQAIDPVLYPELATLAGANVPDYRGIFLRGFGSQSHAQNNGQLIGITTTTHTSGDLGQMQGDGIRNIYGSFGRAAPRSQQPTDYGGDPSGALIAGGAGQYSWQGGSGGHVVATGFSAARVVPTTNENRPANRAVRYFMRALP